MSNAIRNFEELISSTLKRGQKYVSCHFENLLPAGENYASVMLKIQVKIVNENKEEEILHCVGKTCPPSDLLWEVFNTKVTFKKEIAVYTTIVPALNEFGKENGIECLMDFFAQSLGTRISLNPLSNEVDKDAVMLLENLAVQGYGTVDRFTGFDEDSTRFLLRNLATLHAAVIAYKVAKPEDFKKKLRPYLNKDFHFVPKIDIINDLIKRTQDALARNVDCVPYLTNVERAIREMPEMMRDPPKGKDIFITLTHNDFWVNNTMLKYENGKPIANRMVDFQILEYSNLANDVIFFLYSSVELSVIENKTDVLIRFYYDNFIKALKDLKHDVSEYSFESMMEDFALIAKNVQFGHTLFMLRPIMILKGKARELTEMKEDDLLVNTSALHENYYKKIQFTLLDFVKRGWI